MNTQQAKFILHGYRPNGADAGDETFREALGQANGDPALREWFARQQEFDGAVSGKIGAVLPPPGLRESILAGGRVTGTARAHRPWWQQPAWLAAAAGVALLLAVGVARWPGQAARGSLADFAQADAIHSENHGSHGAEAGALQAALSQASTRLGGDLPVDFAALRRAGCRTLSFKEHEVLEVCFKRNGAWFHCYIARRGDFPALAAVAPELVDRNGSSVATWSGQSLVYVVVSKTGRAALERLL